MELLRFLWAVLRVAFKKSLDVTQTILFLALILVGLFASTPFPKRLGMNVPDVSGWQAAALLLGAIVVLRLLAAPYWLWRDEREASRKAAATASRQIASLQEQLKVAREPSPLLMTGGATARAAQSSPPAPPKSLVDDESKRLAGLVQAMSERAIRYDFKLPLPDGDSFVQRHDELLDSAHPIFTRQEMRDARIEFIHACHVSGDGRADSAEDDKAMRRDVREWGERLAGGLLGNA